MKMDRDSAVSRARKDLAERLNISEGDVAEKSVTDREFSNMSLGAPADGEFAAQMIAYGWEIKLEAGGRAYEYRADKYQLRLVGFEGKNYLIS